MARFRPLAVTLVVMIGINACGAPPPAGERPAPSDRPETTTPPPDARPPRSFEPSAATNPAPDTRLGDVEPPPLRYTFPVRGHASYARDHHDYPAADIIADCGSPVVAVVSGSIVELSRTDRYDPEIDDGGTRGGLFVSIIGDDGVRYYGSHFSTIEPDIVVGARVASGQRLGRVGRTGNASACHLHFGISPACDMTDDWWTRRGVIWPWPYLDAWRQDGQRSPAQETVSWQRANGCPGPDVR